MMRRMLLASLVALTAFSGFATTALADRWTRHDGRWYYWSDDDNRYYYMDGRNWFYSGDKGWNVYKFDGKYGRDWEIERDKLEFDDDIEVPTYVVPSRPKVRVKVDD